MGKVREDERQIGGYEVQVSKLQVIQDAADYPIAKKNTAWIFLSRTVISGCVPPGSGPSCGCNASSMPSTISFQANGFLQMDAPIFTGNAVEGTTTLFETDFFGQPAYLSQSGQLYGRSARHGPWQDLPSAPLSCRKNPRREDTSASSG